MERIVTGIHLIDIFLTQMIFSMFINTMIPKGFTHLQRDTHSLHKFHKKKQKI